MSKRLSEIKKKGNEKKRKTDTSDEEDCVDETMTSLDYEPDKMRLLLESFIEYIENHDGSVKNLEKLVSDWSESEKQLVEDVPLDVTVFCQDFKKYLKESVKYSNMNIMDAANLTKRFLSDSKSLPFYKDFPTRPPQAIHIYIHKMKLSSGINEIGAAYEKFKNEDPNVVADVQKDHLDRVTKFSEDLRKFLDNHPLLTEDQKMAVLARMKTLNRKLNSGTSVKTPKKKEPVTAFSLWAKTKVDKYRDLPEEEREEKLLKRFNKLSSAELKLLEDLALSTN